ncbi:MAG: hypothetical protein J1F71_03635 [Clostridiales bacterium]|nr:hypothetical protein [Clostridiales bacterium]
MGKSKDIISGSQINNTIAELYALRAGLSVISERADDVRKLERKIDNENLKISSIESEIDENNRAIKRTREESDRLRQEISNVKNDKSSRVSSHIHNNIKYHPYSLSDFKKFIIFGSIAIIWGFFMIFLSIINGGGEGVAYRIIGIVAIIVGAGLIGVPIIISSLSKKKYNQHRKNLENSKCNEIDDEIRGLQERLDRLQEKLPPLQQKGNELLVKKGDMIKEVEQSVVVIRNNIVSVAQQGELYYHAMETEFASLLNPADWQNTDLCIFYLQTGRAESIKECLLLADRQRQNDEIVGAIRAASDRISSEIRNGFKALGSTMVTCINALSMQIETMSNTLSAQNDSTIRALGAIENSNAALLSATQLNNALQAKANQTSEQLLRDYRYVQNRMGVAI